MIVSLSWFEVCVHASCIWYMLSLHTFTWWKNSSRVCQSEVSRYVSVLCEGLVSWTFANILPANYHSMFNPYCRSGHCNVPATFRHSPLGTWVGKQREEYRKLKDKKSSQLDKYRIDKLNEVGFQWSLQSWKIISWNDRFDVSDCREAICVPMASFYLMCILLIIVLWCTPGSKEIQGRARSRQSTPKSSRFWQLANLSKGTIQAIQSGQKVKNHKGKGG